MLKREGHTHTQFCPHGSGDDAELMIQKAIHMGFQEYSITEHAPLPPTFGDNYAGQADGLTTASISMEQVRPYLDFAHTMQARYAKQIKINVGFEVDYLPGFEEWTTAFLNQYGPETQDSILSVHFMPGRGNRFWCVDYDTQDFEGGFGDLLHEPQHLFEQFYTLELQAAHAELGPYKPERLGHISLVRKYQDFFGLPRTLNLENEGLVKRILYAVKANRMQLDLNVAGLYKEYCNEIYPPAWVVQMAQQMAIPLVYGSDAHSIADVGRGYHVVEQWLE